MVVVLLSLGSRAFAQDFDGDGFMAGVDCDDFNVNVNPIAFEVIGDEVDENCNGSETCFRDLDNDGARTFGTLVSFDVDCDDPTEAVPADPVDCADADPTRHPSAVEGVADGVDQDCDTKELCYYDNDADGYGGVGIGTVVSLDLDCVDLTEATTDTDCDDADPGIHPGVVEIAGDAFDQNCDGQETCWLDSDGDGARSTLKVQSADLDCTDALEAWDWADLDCDDADADRYPAALEVCDGIDEDCDGDADSIELLPALPAVAGGANTWDLVGGPASATVRLVIGTKLGETASTCPNTPYAIGSGHKIATSSTDALGDASLTGFVPAATAGRTVYAQALFPATCELSCVVETAF
ncbi:MAG: MopE-related protein [Myxococcota bacterium]